MLIQAIVFISIVLVLLHFLAPSEEHFFIRASTDMQQIAQHQAVYDDWTNSPQNAFANAYNPQIMGVPIRDKNSLFVKSARQSGMLEGDTSLDIGGFAQKGPLAYHQDLAVLQDSLELQTTQDYLRHHLATTMSSYMPPEGVDNNSGLWYQRNYLENLTQPGLSALPKHYKLLSEQGY
jgi:hypothetical protein